MFSKRWSKLIILLFLAMLIPLILYNYAFDTVEGNVALATACANGTGAVGACGKLKASADEATKAQARLMADLKKKADDKAKAAVDNKSKAAVDNKPKAAVDNKSKAAVSKDTTEEDSELAELFTVNNGTGDFAYAYALEPFYEGATSGKKGPAFCRIINNRFFPIIDNKNITNDKKITELTEKFNYYLEKKKCTRDTK